MKKSIKILLWVLLGPPLLATLLHVSFLGIEYLTGEKFVEYLEQNSETLALDETFSFDLAHEDILNSKLILTGESHGLHEPGKFDLSFFKHLYKNYGVRTYIAELDCAQAAMMNVFMETGDETLLKDILKNWVVAQGRNNKDYQDKFKAFHKFYQELPEHDKFKFLGIDKIQDWRFLTYYVNHLAASDSNLIPLEFDKNTILAQLKERITLLDSLNVENMENDFVYKHLYRNLTHYENKIQREDVMFLNFRDFYLHYGLSEQRSYGFFGLYHIFQYSIDGDLPLAAQIRQSKLGLEGKMISMNFMFVDSHMVMKSNALPRFLQDGGKYTKMGVTADNMLIMYIVGVQDFKRMTPAYHKSFVKMNGENNPYADAKRLNKIIQILPLTNIFKMTDKGKEYVQYTIFVRNSDWAEPLED